MDMMFKIIGLASVGFVAVLMVVAYAFEMHHFRKQNFVSKGDKVKVIFYGKIEEFEFVSCELSENKVYLTKNGMCYEMTVKEFEDNLLDD